MFSIKNRNGLKGQNNLAEGKRRRSDALGCKRNIVIVRAMTFIRKKFLFRTKDIASIFREIISRDSLPAAGWRPKEIICFVYRLPSDGFCRSLCTQGGVSVRSS